MESLLNQQDGKCLVDSRQVAEMIGKRHDNLLRDIDRYVEVLNKNGMNPNLRALDFFIASTYKDSKGEVRRFYLLTRLGCNMVANKMTGEKGTWFTASYVTKFEEMEKELKQRTPQTYKEALFAAYQAEEEKEQRLSKL
ncbi:Rha family transcriptional regulator [Paenibacillus oryzisoli]|uniref:Rha family transcriptional regulator n=1 Tax=Paenibacillus oryzisoli TaxID=1850517 RepID=UPI003D2DA5B6